MIKINLLPVKQIKKNQKVRREVVGFLISLLTLFVVMGVVAYGKVAHIDNLKVTINKLQQERNKYQSTIKEIEKLKKDKAKLETKLATIKKLKRGSQITVRVLDEIASLTPANRLWLNSLNQTAGQLKLSGIALDNETIAQYMDRIKDSPYFSRAELNKSSLTVVAGRKLKSFSLTCSIVDNTTEDSENLPHDEKSNK